jgi:uncharacterized Zn finger protein
MSARRPSSRRRAGRSGPPADGWWPAPSTPIPVEGGLQARSKRGPIGDTWWSQRFITVLETIGIGSRLQRGKRYARSGQVLTMELGAGQVKASVQGSRAKPYRVFIENEVLSTSDWDAIESVMVSSAVFAARLLAGEMPEEIEEAFADSSTSLFPVSADEIASACSCPDWENPCKHIAAVYYLLAEAFDGDPFLIFAWRGRTKEELLGGLRARRRGSLSKDGPHSRVVAEKSDTGPLGWPRADPDRISPTQEIDPMSWWGVDDNLAAIEIRPRLAVAPDLVLRQLDPEPLAADGERIIDELRGLYEAITAGSAVLALEEDPE